MADMQSTVTLDEGMAFDVALGDHHFFIDAKAEHGGTDRGPSPKSLVLSALAGCTAMDVISMLRKMRQPVETFAVTAEANKTTDGHPVTLVDFVVTYTVTGDVDPKRLWRAVDLSEGTYCGVSAMLKKHSAVTAKVVLNGTELPKPVG